MRRGRSGFVVAASSILTSRGARFPVGQLSKQTSRHLARFASHLITLLACGKAIAEQQSDLDALFTCCKSNKLLSSQTNGQSLEKHAPSFY